MKLLSSWASQHRWTARLTIMGLYVVVNTCGLLAGDLLHLADVHITQSSVYLLAFAALAAMVFYPVTSNRADYKALFSRRKSFDLFLTCCTFFLLVCLGNGNKAFSFSQPAVGAAHASSTSFSAEGKPRLSKKSMIKKIRENIRTIRNMYRDGSKAEKTALIILVVILGLAAAFGIAALSCSLSCNGSEALALVVLLLGTALIVFLGSRAIRSIKRGPKNPTEKETPAQ